MDFITAFNNKMKLVILTNTNICYSDDLGWVSLPTKSYDPWSRGQMMSYDIWEMFHLHFYKILNTKFGTVLT